jgi:hypothetical protein
VQNAIYFFLIWGLFMIGQLSCDRLEKELAAQRKLLKELQRQVGQTQTGN